MANVKYLFALFKILFLLLNSLSDMERLILKLITFLRFFIDYLTNFLYIYDRIKS